MGHHATVVAMTLGSFLDRHHGGVVARTNNGLGEAMGSELQPRRNIAGRVSGRLARDASRERLHRLISYTTAGAVDGLAGLLSWLR